MVIIKRKREYFILNLKMMQEASKRRCNKIKLLSLSFVSKIIISLRNLDPCQARARMPHLKYANQFFLFSGSDLVQLQNVHEQKLAYLTTVQQQQVNFKCHVPRGNSYCAMQSSIRNHIQKRIIQKVATKKCEYAICMANVLLCRQLYVTALRQLYVTCFT